MLEWAFELKLVLVKLVPGKAMIGLMAFLSIAAFALTCAGYVDSHRYLEILSDYRPFLLAWGGLCLIASSLILKPKHWRVGKAIALSASFFVIVINGIEVIPWLLAAKARPANSAPGKQTFKAAAFNVEGVNNWYSQTRAWLQEESPDIAMFCECNPQWSEQLQSLTNEFPHHLRTDAMDIEVFSRHPITRTQVSHFGPQRGFVAVGISLNGTEISFVAAHTYPRYWMKHAGFQWRTEALEQGLGKQLKELPQPLLVMGDLNASPWSPAFKRMINTSGLLDARRGRGLLATQHGHGTVTKLLWRPIDHCLHSPKITITDFRTGPDLNSDHLPLVAEFYFPTGN